jgi:segregation and condensation protein B
MMSDNGELSPAALSRQLQNLVEALLFVAQEPVSVEDLAKCLEIPPEVVGEALEALGADLSGRGVCLQRLGSRVQLVTRPQAAIHIERFLGLERTGRLSPAAFETLALIAYRQPITRAGIEGVRGVNSDGVLRTLLSHGLVEEVGRLEQPGRPFMYGTTFQFLQQFGLKSVGDLPVFADDAAETTAVAEG